MSLGTPAPVIVWFRADLRIGDNLALLAAQNLSAPIICVYILDASSVYRARGAAQNWWLHNSLVQLNSALNGLGTRLILCRGNTEAEIARICSETNASAIFWNRRYDPAAHEIDIRIKRDLRAKDMTVETFDGQLLHEPTRIKTGGGTAFKVYTPFWRAFMSSGDPRPPLPAPVKLIDGSAGLTGERLEDWRLQPDHPNWAVGINAEWTPGELGAQERLATFMNGAVDGYAENRNLPFQFGTSKLSPHLAMGEITPFQIWEAANKTANIPPADLEVFRKEIVWREFAHHLLFHFPKLSGENFNASFDNFEWGPVDAKFLRAWQNGSTGYPIVDAGMRQLRQIGWMHNRVRMITASFLIKHLMIDWRTGEKWFWDTLVDACPANNPAGWQWVAGSGADASPYYRIFNPIIQGEKFDADGKYVRQYIPELKNLPSKFIHKPWEAPLSVLKTAGITLGEHYPRPIVDHSTARDRAMNAFKTLRGTA